MIPSQQIDRFASAISYVIRRRTALRHRLSVARDVSRLRILARVTFSDAADVIDAHTDEFFVENGLLLAFGEIIVGAVDRVEEARIGIRDLVDQ